MKKFHKLLTGALAGLGLAAAAFSAIDSTPAQAQVPIPGPAPLPSPRAFVSNLDLECYRPATTTPPLVDSLIINHLNPVLNEMGIKREKIAVGALDEVCVPVTKNKKVPPALPLRYLSYTDLACYKAKSEKPLDVRLHLTHLNPVLREMGISDADVVTGRLEQLCTPVQKKGADVPAYAKRLVEHIDVACYRIETQSSPFGLRLDHQNPLLSSYPEHHVKVRQARHLCLPVAKNDKLPPDDILKIVRWIDLEKFPIEDSAGATPLNLVLTHLNPLFADVSPFVVYAPRPSSLMVPVAKNSQFPPL
jgi:hypothetical protein